MTKLLSASLDRANRNLPFEIEHQLTILRQEYHRATISTTRSNPTTIYSREYASLLRGGKLSYAFCHVRSSASMMYVNSLTFSHAMTAIISEPARPLIRRRLREMAGELADVVGGFTVKSVVPGNPREASGLLRAITEMRVRLMSCRKSAIVRLPAPSDRIEQSSALEITHLSSPRRRPVWTGGGRPPWLECDVWL